MVFGPKNFTWHFLRTNLYTILRFYIERESHSRLTFSWSETAGSVEICNGNTHKLYYLIGIQISIWWQPYVKNLYISKSNKYNLTQFVSVIWFCGRPLTSTSSLLLLQQEQIRKHYVDNINKPCFDPALEHAWSSQGCMHANLIPITQLFAPIFHLLQHSCWSLR
jgi:hypothetical protein